MGSGRACLVVGDVRLVGAMRYVMFFALVQTLVSGFVFGEPDTGQHPEEFRGTVTRSVQMKYLLFIPDGYGDKTVLAGRDHGILDTYENEELYSWFLEHARSEKDNP